RSAAPHCVLSLRLLFASPLFGSSLRLLFAAPLCGSSLRLLFAAPLCGSSRRELLTPPPLSRPPLSRPPLSRPPLSRPPLSRPPLRGLRRSVARGPRRGRAPLSQPLPTLIHGEGSLEPPRAPSARAPARESREASRNPWAPSARTTLAYLKTHGDFQGRGPGRRGRDRRRLCGMQRGRDRRGDVRVVRRERGHRRRRQGRGPRDREPDEPRRDRPRRRQR